MVYGIYLTLDQPRWKQSDYSDTNLLTGTIWSDRDRTVAFDLTGYAIQIRIFNRFGGGDRFDKTATIVTAASGTWSFAVAQSDMVGPSNRPYLVEAEVSKTGEVMSTLNVVEFWVLEAPTQ